MINKEAYGKAIVSLDDGVKSDINAILENSMKYPDFIPVWRDSVYDNFLKSQGAKAGNESYNQLIMLRAAYLRKQSKGKY